MGLTTAINRIKDSKAKSKIIILLTDGVNNTGFIDPKTASELAVEYGIKTYTVGLGSNGNALSPIALNPMVCFRYGLSKWKLMKNCLKKSQKTQGENILEQLTIKN